MPSLLLVVTPENERELRPVGGKNRSQFGKAGRGGFFAERSHDLHRLVWAPLCARPDPSGFSASFVYFQFKLKSVLSILLMTDQS
jgi:hypothetical protein